MITIVVGHAGPGDAAVLLDELDALKLKSKAPDGKLTLYYFDIKVLVVCSASRLLIFAHAIRSVRVCTAHLETIDL